MITKDRGQWVFGTKVGKLKLDTDRIFANNVIFPWEYNPHGIAPWIVYGEFGPLALIWAEHEQDLLDEAADSGVLDGYLVSEEDYASASEDERADWTPLGNASEPFDLTYINVAKINPKDFPPELIASFAAAREAGYETIDM